MIVSFEFYVMNFVDFVVDCNSHITSHVSQAFPSCTHNTSYSLLNIIHVIVCVLVWPTKFEKYFEFYAQLICCLKKKREIVWNLNFWENWVLNLGFVKIISSHTYAFFFLIFQCFEERLHQILLFLKNSFFLQFRLIEFVFRSIEIVIKNFDESLSVSIDRNCFFDQSNIVNQVF